MKQYDINIKIYFINQKNCYTDLKPLPERNPEAYETHSCHPQSTCQRLYPG